MSKSFIHKFRISGMYDSAGVAAVRNRMAKIPGVGAVSVDLRKMQVQITSTRAIEAVALRSALGYVEFDLSGLTTSVITTPSGFRDDELEQPDKTI